MEFVVSIFESFSAFMIAHAPFFGVAALLTYTGQFFAKKVFTKERAYARTFHPNTRLFFWYGREGLPMHPIIAGALLGVFWRHPEPGMTSMRESVVYFGSAGVVGLLCWLVAKAVAKNRGIVLDDPFGSSVPPLTPFDADDEIQGDATNPRIYTDRLPLPGKLPTLSAEVEAKLMKANRGTSP